MWVQKEGNRKVTGVTTPKGRRIKDQSHQGSLLYCGEPWEGTFILLWIQHLLSQIINAGFFLRTLLSSNPISFSYFEGNWDDSWRDKGFPFIFWIPNDRSKRWTPQLQECKSNAKRTSEGIGLRGVLYESHPNAYGMRFLHKLTTARSTCDSLLQIPTDSKEMWESCVLFSFSLFVISYDAPVVKAHQFPQLPRQAVGL